ncbi:hypothetical protein VKT23_005095 [Stygiomarasmius scandens]|uniref:Uncharacterized protein n=1 Tax=Marasmiellus scandens TaxID=2682957 RepID=A0ABR1JUP6_9AGAR
MTAQRENSGALSGLSLPLSFSDSTKNKNSNVNRQDQQSSLTLDSRVIASGFANDGQDQPEAGQVPSLTSPNNFVNFCLMVSNLPIANGQQLSTGSCNPAPRGVSPSVDNMPSTKFTFPRNGGTLKAGDPFTISIATQKLETGFYTNFRKTFLAAPQQISSDGLVFGYYTIVIDELSSPDQTTPTDPKQFVFWRVLFRLARSGVVTVDVDTGLPAGDYRLTATPYAANHQPIFSPVQQHGFFGDVIYFNVTGNAQVRITLAEFPPEVSSAMPTGTTATTSIAPTSSNPNLPGGSSGSRVNIKAIAGRAVSGVLFLALIIVSWLYLRSLRRQRQQSTNRLLSGRMSQPLTPLRQIIIPILDHLEERHTSAPETSDQQAPALDVSQNELVQTVTMRSSTASDTTLEGVDFAPSGSLVRQTSDWSLHPTPGSLFRQSIHDHAHRVSDITNLSRQAIAGSVASDATLTAWLPKTDNKPNKLEDSGSGNESEPPHPSVSSPTPLLADTDSFRVSSERIPSWSTMSSVPSYHTNA